MTVSRHSKENKGREVFNLKRNINNRLPIVFIVICLVLIALLIKVYLIQHNNKEDYDRIVLSQRQSEYVSRTIPYRRGDIFDRNGNRLATSEKVYILILDPAQMIEYEAIQAVSSKKRNAIEPTVEAISQYFGIDAAEIRRTIRDNPSSSYIRLKKDVSYDDKQKFTEIIENKNKEYIDSDKTSATINRIKGVWFEDNYKRTYPYGSLACNVLGYSTSDGTGGNGGVEQYYNESLVGTNGREYGYLNDEADLEKVIKSAENGNSLVLTIDANIQNIVENKLAEWKNGDIGSKSAACIVMNPNNGEVLAMASTNTYDLNNPTKIDDIDEEEEYELGLSEAVRDYKKKHSELVGITKDQVPEYYTREQIINLGKMPAIYKKQRNICVSDSYEPGSTQKIFTVAGAIEENVISEHNTFECKGYVQLSDGINSWKIKCVNRNGHGILDVTGGITNSCNVVMMNIAFAEKNEMFMKYEKLFGFGGLTGIDLPAEINTKKLGFETNDIGRTQLATYSFGQNYNCSMIQMASAYCSIINGGSYYRPHVVKQILDQDGTVIEDISPVLVNETVSETTCDFIKEALVKTVTDGTGKAAKVKGYKVGGKTGTAQKLPRSAQTYVVSFCGYAPADDPELLCYVIVDEPNLPGEEAAHSSFASEIFSKIMTEALPVMNIEPDNEEEAEHVVPTALLPVVETGNETVSESLEKAGSENTESKPDEMGSVNADTESSGNTETDTSNSQETEQGINDPILINTIPGGESENESDTKDGGMLPDELSMMWNQEDNI